MQNLTDSLNWIDIVLLGLALAAFVLGLVKGFVWQVTRLITLVGGCLLANRYSTELAPSVRQIFPSLEQPADRYIAYFVIFVSIAVVMSLFAYLLRNVIERLQLGTYDRIFGGGLGLINAAVLLMVVLLGVGALADEGVLVENEGYRQTIRESRLLPPTYRFVQELTVLFPGELRELARDLLQDLPLEEERPQTPAQDEIDPNAPAEVSAAPRDDDR
ncbi:MAG: CvpA family protein [Planctomycetota bacterium]